MPDEGNEDLETTCALCGRSLNSGNRSSTQNDLCKMCAGEEDDSSEDMDIK